MYCSDTDTHEKLRPVEEMMETVYERGEALVYFGTVDYGDRRHDDWRSIFALHRRQVPNCWGHCFHGVRCRAIHQRSGAYTYIKVSIKYPSGGREFAMHPQKKALRTATK